ncbi:MAG: hypothetical protein E6Q97_36145 [Desulfurellales bacterium]|nr:MAG: hypothetical protein E6Q97_36145 [Desulfurellales bacterium]
MTKRYVLFDENGDVFATDDKDGLERLLEQDDTNVIFDTQTGKYSYDMAEWKNPGEPELPEEEEDEEDEEDEG